MVVGATNEMPILCVTFLITTKVLTLFPFPKSKIGKGHSQKHGDNHEKKSAS
jgi:hypothetical protein